MSLYNVSPSGCSDWSTTSIPEHILFCFEAFIARTTMVATTNDSKRDHMRSAAATEIYRYPNILGSQDAKCKCNV